MSMSMSMSITKYLLFFMIMLLMFYTLYRMFFHHEYTYKQLQHFQSGLSEPIKQIFTTNISNMKDLLDQSTQEVSIDIMTTLIHVLQESKEIPNNWQGTTICIDDVDLVNIQKGNDGIFKKIQQEGYFVRLIHPQRVNEMKCPYDIVNRNIGVFDICDKHLVQAIASGYRIPNKTTTVNIEFIPQKNWKNISTLLETTYDVIYAYIIPKSAFESMIYSQYVYVSGFDKMDISRINVFYPNIKMRKAYMDSIYSWDTSENVAQAVYKREGTENLLWVSQNLFIISDPKNIKHEPFITELKVSDEMSDPSYRCYGDLKNENRALCNSSYDPWGELKVDQTYWDIPCLENKDCPFYKANKNYPNEFGKCQTNGICEFPVGVRRLAYIKYRDDFPYLPMCYGCDPDISDCCRDQKENPEKYPALLSPDYAFPNDITQRAPRGLSTTIPLSM